MAKSATAAIGHQGRLCAALRRLTGAGGSKAGGATAGPPGPGLASRAKFEKSRRSTCSTVSVGRNVKFRADVSPGPLQNHTTYTRVSLTVVTLLFCQQNSGDLA